MYICPKYATEDTPEPYREWLLAISDGLDSATVMKYTGLSSDDLATSGGIRVDRAFLIPSPLGEVFIHNFALACSAGKLMCG
ncbi:hypothetical protein [Candidatus Marithrix sp. Canyon 246]|uniref:hypothetical protein n=1 Tax=Candidatus Marithrix sp. Canyon 246 TaxID=1827136 RepID=UPI00084A2342|nr:hypothetical protein [Candidatus Marithrix sp. Canyon 246]